MHSECCIRWARSFSVCHYFTWSLSNVISINGNACVLQWQIPNVCFVYMFSLFSSGIKVSSASTHSYISHSTSTLTNLTTHTQFILSHAIPNKNIYQYINTKCNTHYALNTHIDCIQISLVANQQRTASTKKCICLCSASMLQRNASYTWVLPMTRNERMILKRIN